MRNVGYNKEDNLSKNDYFRLMLSEVVAWGLRPSYVTGDSWYSSKENLKFLKKQGLGFMIGIVKTYKILPSVLVKNVRISRRADNWYVRFKPTFRTTELYDKKLQDNIYLIKYSYL